MGKIKHVAIRLVLMLAVAASMLATGPAAEAATSGYGCTMHVWEPGGDEGNDLAAYTGKGSMTCDQIWTHLFLNVSIYGSFKGGDFTGNLYPMTGAEAVGDVAWDTYIGPYAATAYCPWGGDWVLATDVNGHASYRNDGGVPYTLLEIWSSRVTKSCNLAPGLVPWPHPF